MGSTIRIGVVGCARILPAHLRGLKELRSKGLEDVYVTALCARQAQDALMFRKRGEGPAPRPSVITHAVSDPLNAPHMYVSDLHGDVLPEVYTDWREMLQRADVDAVLILTPVHLHHQVALDCLRAGKHVLIEKPIAISVKAGQQMVAEAAARGLVLGVAESARYSRDLRTLRWLLDTGRIGDVQMWLSGGMGALDWSPDAIVAQTPWRHRKLEAGGGPAVDGAVHLFDQIRYLCGEIDEISAVADRLEPVRVTRDGDGKVVASVENEVEDAYIAHLKFASGAVGMVFGGWAGHGEPTRLEGGATIYGTRGCIKGGTMILDNGRRLLGQDLYEAEAPASLQERWFPAGVQDRFALELLSFVQATWTGGPMETGGEDGVRDLACSFAILESSAARCPVKVADVLDGHVDLYQREINAHYGL